MVNLFLWQRTVRFQSAQEEREESELSTGVKSRWSERSVKTVLCYCRESGCGAVLLNVSVCCVCSLSDDGACDKEDGSTIKSSCESWNGILYEILILRSE